MFLHTSIGGDERFAEETTATSRLGKTHRSSRTKSKCVRVGERACVGTAWSSTAPLARAIPNAFSRLPMQATNG